MCEVDKTYSGYLLPTQVELKSENMKVNANLVEDFYCCCLL